MVIVDTHVWVWIATDPKKLSRRAATAISRALRSGGIGIASVSIWELAMLFDRGRLRAAGTLEGAIHAMVDRTGVIVQEITPEIAALSTAFPASFSADPADRLIGATARALGMPLITKDQKILDSKLIETIW